VKLADRLHNMRTLDACSPEKRQRIAAETLDIYAPIANRLGMRRFLVEFEDRAFQALHPARHRVLFEALHKIARHREQAMQHIQQTLESKLAEQQIFVHELVGREKHLYSIYRKMRQKRLSFSEIMDVYAFRIVVEDVDTCYRVLGVVHNCFKPLPERFKDYIAIPKSNGYQSLHTTLFGPNAVPMEIQIRTKEMNNIASNGIAGHWLYKTGSVAVTDAQLRARNWLKGLLEIQKSTGNSLEFIENVKFDLFPDEVYVFTPKGDIMELPTGATPVDFAYAVHSDVGQTCVAAKVDRRLAPLSTRLANGQRVEIIVSADARPNPSWLDFVVTGKARSSIRHYLKNQLRADLVVLGRRLLAQRLSLFGTTLEDLAPEKIEAVLQAQHCTSLDELFENVGLGHKMAPVIVAQLLAQNDDMPIDSSLAKASPEPLCIEGTEGVSIKFAECCYPLPGEAIMGYLMKGQGMLIHRADCKQVSELCRQEGACIEVRWDEKVSGQFKSALLILVMNQQGVLARITAVFAESGANIENITVEPQDTHYTSIHLSLMVHDRTHLAQVMRKLRAIKQVVRLIRA
jgi:guanosine-3',5'-bis(diphosphate) 3'-pyrophosphohydrolase